MRAKLAKLVVVDAVGLAEQRGSSPWMFVRDLSELAFDRMSTEGAEERLAIGLGIAAPLIGALIAATGVLPVDARRRAGRRPRRHAPRCRAAHGRGLPASAGTPTDGSAPDGSAAGPVPVTHAAPTG